MSKTVNVRLVEICFKSSKKVFLHFSPRNAKEVKRVLGSPPNNLKKQVCRLGPFDFIFHLKGGCFVLFH